MIKKVIKRTLGWAIIVLLFIVVPITMALDKTDPVSQFIGMAWISVWLLAGIMVLLYWLFQEEE